MAGFDVPAMCLSNLHYIYLCGGRFFKTTVFCNRTIFIHFQAEGCTMGEKCEWPCWEIMKCDASKKCPAKIRPETPCWEIAREQADYRYILQICTDCIVHLLKGQHSVLSQKEIQSIMVNKANCVLTSEECLGSY